MAELDEIQGNVLSGFNTSVEILIGLSADFDRAEESASWLAGLAPSLTTVADIREQREAVKAQLSGADNGLVWLGLGIGPELLNRVRADLFFFDEGFNVGFRKRSRSVLGDRTDPKSWRIGGPNNPLDVLLIVASNDEVAANHRADELATQATLSGFRAPYREVARKMADLEHFGFRDGISQPLVQGVDRDGDIALGNFVFGYERRIGDSPYLPGGDPKGYLRNGSFLVFRRLAQDVRAFRQFCIDKTAQLATQFPSLTAPHLEALIVGRWPQGALVSVKQANDPGRQPNDNKFDFPADITRADCPFGAHIRKVNPRSGPKDVVDVPRILRRGIPFGPPFDSAPDDERGLAFLSYQTSIQEQLEFLTASWMNNPNLPAPRSGHDLLVGRNNSSRSMRINFPTGETEVSDDGQQWITPTGGGYLFAPGKTNLGRLTQPIATGIGWKVEKLLNKASILIKTSIDGL